MAERKPLLELSAPVGGQISINGQLYDTVHPDAFSMQERIQYAHAAKQFMNIAELDEAKAGELVVTLDHLVERVLKAPEEVRKALPDGHKLAIIRAVFTQGAGTQNSEKTTESFPTSSVSTGAIQ